MDGGCLVHKEDYIDLLKVAEGIMKLEKASRIMTGACFDEGEAYTVYQLWEVLRRNAAKRFHDSADNDLNIKTYRMFMDIVEDLELAVEEKYQKLMSE